MDKNERLIRLSEKGRFWRVPFEDLSRAEQVFRAVWDLESDVNNGGFDQYYFNSSGDTAFAVVDALRTIGADKVARIVADANAVFPNSAPPRGREEREDALDAFTSKQSDALSALDEKFYEYPDDLTDLLHDYVERHADSIEGAADVGM